MNNYIEINKQIESLTNDTKYEITLLSNVSSFLYEVLDNVSWVGFYLYNKDDKELYLGPFMGKIACEIIKEGKGVCGNALSTLKTIRVDNVLEYPGHIACDSSSRSEIVIPILLSNQKYGVLDIDSHSFSNFTKNDEEGLEELVNIITKTLSRIKQ